MRKLQKILLLILFAFLFLVTRELLCRHRGNRTPKPFIPKPIDWSQPLNLTFPIHSCLLSPRQFKICIHNPSQDKFISSSYAKGGEWEGDISQRILEKVSEVPGTEFLDIGANIGTHALALAKEGVRVTAVECSREHWEKLHHSVLLNNFHKHFQLFPYCLSDNHSQSLVLSKAKDNAGHTYVLRAAAKRIQSVMRIPVGSVIELEDLVPFLPKDKPIVVKMDIEKYECVVLRQAQRFFDSLSVPYIFMEWILDFAGFDRACAADLVNNMQMYGYKAQNLNGKDLPMGKMVGLKIGDIIWVKVEK